MGGYSLLRGRGGDAAWRAHFHTEVARLRRELPPGADSWEPHRPKDEVVNIAEKIVGDIRRDDLPRPFVVPGSEGSLQIKWRTSPSKELSLFISPASVEFLQVDADRMSEGDLKDSKSLLLLIDWLLS